VRHEAVLVMISLALQSILKNKTAMLTMLGS
jgi:hypothetical protein